LEGPGEDLKGLTKIIFSTRKDVVQANWINLHEKVNYAQNTVGREFVSGKKAPPPGQ